jgi:hypothetical protein
MKHKTLMIHVGRSSKMRIQTPNPMQTPPMKHKIRIDRNRKNRTQCILKRSNKSCTLGTSWEYSVICKLTKCIVLLQQASLASSSCITSHMAFPPGSNTFYAHKPSVGDLFAFYFRVRKRYCSIWQQFKRKVAVRAGWWALIRISVFVQVISCLLVP